MIPDSSSRFFIFALALPAGPLNAAPTLTVNGVEANYTTTKVYLDELAAESFVLEIVLDPDESAAITDAEVFTNLNNRDRANEDANGDGVHDGIQPPSGDVVVSGSDIHYYTATDLAAQGDGTFTGTLNALKTGAYRLTARWKVQGDSNWRYYSNLSQNRRDHAVTVSPSDARKINLYEVNTLTIEAREGAGQFIERSTFEDLYDAPGAPRTVDGKGFNLDYLTGLGVNWLWFQPVHPPALDGRETDMSTGNPYLPGSPYAVKNFFEINPWMSASYDGLSDISSPANRASAMLSFQNFVAASDAEGIGVMLDAPFNHTGFDCEFAQAGVDLFQRDGDPLLPGTEIRNYDARFFSRSGDYCQRASSAGSIAIAPDRNDFGKFVDTFDVFFGRYDALICTDTPADNDDHLDEGDWFDFSDTNWTNTDITVNGIDRNVTKQVWRYFAEYALHWLEMTGYPEGTPHTEASRGLGIDGLRCDFAQGLPPRAWEYISNVARERKWNFVMMAESLDGGPVTYRSNRHFDILNENIVFPLKAASTAGDYRTIFDQRRSQYAGALVLTNSTSHDEENYVDPFEALVRYAVTNAVQGVPLIFMGQEQGISRTFGFTFYETNLGKEIGHFKKFNSLQPVWDDTAFANAQLYPCYAAIGQARLRSPALRAATEFYLSGNSQIFGVAKYTDAGVPPAVQDVVLAFANVDRNASPTGNFALQASLTELMGLKDGRSYNVKNIAAFDPADRDNYLWAGSGFTKGQLESGGVFVAMNRVPTSGAAWSTAPYEAQYLKVFDTTTPPAPDTPVSDADYVIGTEAEFTWTTSSFSEDDVAEFYTVNGNVIAETNTVILSGVVGDVLTATVSATTPAGVTGPGSPVSVPVKLLSAAGDEDGDGQSNAAEDVAGTSPLDAGSSFSATVALTAPGTMEITWPVAAGRVYSYQTSEDLESWSAPQPAPATGFLTISQGLGGRLFYRILVNREPGL